MRRPLLLLILLGLAAGGVLLVMLGSDPPDGDGDPAPSGQRQDRPETDVAPMSSDDRTAIRDQTPAPAVPSGQLPAAVTMTFELRERINRNAISQVNYKLLGPKGLRREADGAKTPVTVAIWKQGSYVVVFQKPGFFPREVEFAVTGDSKDRHFNLAMRRAQGRVRVEVRDRATLNPMEGFKVRVTYRNDGSGKHASTWAGPIADTYYDAFLRLDANSFIQVEAPGYTPSEEKPVRVTAVEPEAKLTFFLQRAMPFTGIELRIFDATLHPAKRVRVVAEIKRPDGSYQEAWNRQASRDNGIYRLPNIKPGTYRLTVRSVPPEGGLDMHVPFVKEIEFTGGEQYQLRVQLQAGARILLKVTDQEGKLLGQDVRVSLATAAGEPVRTLWEHIDDDGKPLLFTAIGANGLVQDGRARLWDPVPPGQYRLRVQRGSADGRTVPITLEAGATRAVRVKL